MNDDTVRTAGSEVAEADDPRQPRLPLDGPDRPIDYVLTARARRRVAPETLPDLTVVPGREAVFDPHDPRKARARALRRAGRSVEDVAGELGVDVAVVREWCGGVRPRTARRRWVRRGPLRELDPQVRLEARSRAEHALADDAVDAAIGGLVAGLAVVAGAAVTVTPPDPAMAAAVVGWLRRETGADPVRAIVAVGPGAARDLVAEDWADRLGLARDRVTAVPWGDAPDPASVRVTVRCADARVAAMVAGWSDAVAGLGHEPLDGVAEDAS